MTSTWRAIDLFVLRTFIVWVVSCAAAWGVVGTPIIAEAQGPPALLFRVFLKDGTPVVSYGEYTRAGDRVFLTVPLGSASAPDGFQVVSLPNGVVDWDRTTHYSDTIRFRHYAATRGDADYTALTAEVARALSEIALSRSTERKLAVAKQVRALLVEWPRTHYGYRSREVRDLTLVLDEAISAVQADLGQSQFSFDLVAVLEPPPGDPLPEPTLAESIESARAVVRASDSPAERMSLRHAILAVLQSKKPSLPSDWMSSMRRSISAGVRRESRETRAYAQLTAETVKSAAKQSARGNVTGVERVLANAIARDWTLGRQRADEMAALLATLESHLDAARVRRLEFDRWEYRKRTYAAYRTGALAATRRLGDLSNDVDAIRAQSGPDPSRLPHLLSRLDDVARALAALAPPLELLDAHGALVSSVSLMSEAVRQRRAAIISADRQRAGNASAAAAGSLLLLSRARSSVANYFAKPGSR